MNIGGDYAPWKNCEFPPLSYTNCCLSFSHYCWIFLYPFLRWFRKSKSRKDYHKMECCCNSDCPYFLCNYCYYCINPSRNYLTMFQRLFFLILAFLAPVLHADMVSNIQQPKDTISFTSPSELVVLVIRYTIGIAGILWVIGITWWGIQMILSVGEDEKQKKARYMIIYSVLWVIIAWLAYSVVNVLSSVQL